MKKKYAVTVSVCATMFIEANSPSEAEQIALDNFEDGRDALIFSIDQNGYEADYDDGLTEEYEDENEPQYEYEDEDEGEYEEEEEPQYEDEAEPQYELEDEDEEDKTFSKKINLDFKEKNLKSKLKI